MKLLFAFFVISYFLAFAEIWYLIGNIIDGYFDFSESPLKEIVLKILLPIISIIFIICIFVYVWKVSSIFGFIAFCVINVILFFVFGCFIAGVMEDDSELWGPGGIFTVILIIALFWFASIKTDEKIVTETITVPLYETSDSTDRKSFLMNIVEEENNKLYFTLEYDEKDTKGIELPTDFNNISELKINESSENKLVITKKTITKINFYSYFDFKKKKSYAYDYNLFINKDCIQILGN